MTDTGDLLGKLDLPAKVRLLTGASFFGLHGDDALGLAPMALSDGPTGVKGLSGTAPASLLPNATTLACSWDEALLHEAGELLADEAVRQGVDVVLGPTINLHRSPLGGRLFECFSEDPLLTGRLAAALVRGLQSRGVGACLKHLVGNEAETERHTVDVQIDDATLREVYLLPFEIAVADANPWAIMAAYNRVNGVPATEQDAVINGVVKGEWSYDGVVVSDWFATTSTGPAITGGLDLVMPGPMGPWGPALVQAVETGAVPESLVDDAVHRLLRLADRVGALGAPGPRPVQPPQPTDDDRRATLRRSATAGMTVLVNDGVLPLTAGTRVALLGVPARETLLQGGGSAQVTPPSQASVRDGLEDALPGLVTYAGGVEIGSPPPARPGFVTDPVDGRPGLRAELVAADGEVLLAEHIVDARRLVGIGDDVSRPVARIRLSGRIESTGPLQLGVIGIGTWTVAVGEVHRTVVVPPVSGTPGEAILAPPTRLLDVNVHGPVLVETELELADVHAMVGLVARPAPLPDDEAIDAAVAAARDADVAVVVVGLTEGQETESRDKTTLALPGAQDALVRAVAGAARRTVVVVNAATPVLMPWADRVDAILVAGLPGQEGGAAVADALLGRREPSGRLVTTWPVADGATPSWSVTPVEGALAYEEGPFVGYRGHAAGRAPEPHFWFGHGLGYGTWDYLGAKVDATGQAPTVTVRLRNTSDRASREVVQVYFSPADADQPVRLAGWTAHDVSAGDTVEVAVRCDPRMWRRWNAAAGSWAALDQGELLVARGLGDVRLRLATG
jgi:beta-glucosidase